MLTTILVIYLILNRNTNLGIITQLKDNEKILKQQLSTVEKQVEIISKEKQKSETNKPEKDKQLTEQLQQNKDQDNLINELKNQIKTTKDSLSTLKLQIDAVNKLPKYQDNYIDYSNNFSYPAYTQSVLPVGGMYTKIPNVPYFNPNWYRVGLLISHPKADHHGKKENATVLTLFRKDIMPDRDFYQYKVRDEFAPGKMEIYLPSNITLLKNDNKVHVLGFENKGPFIVKLDDQYRFAFMY
jgi:hypothetical protein